MASQYNFKLKNKPGQLSILLEQLCRFPDQRFEAFSVASCSLEDPDLPSIFKLVPSNDDQFYQHLQQLSDTEYERNPVLAIPLPSPVDLYFALKRAFEANPSIGVESILSVPVQLDERRIGIEIDSQFHNQTLTFLPQEWLPSEEIFYYVRVISQPGAVYEVLEILQRESTYVYTVTGTACNLYGYLEILTYANNTSPIDDILNNNGYWVQQRKMITVVLPNQLEHLYNLAKLLSENNINIERIITLPLERSRVHTRTYFEFDDRSKLERFRALFF